MKTRKNPEADLKKFYTVFLQIGLLATLIIFIVAVKLDLTGNTPDGYVIDEQDIIEMEDIVQTRHLETPPPPPKIPVPQEVPNDEIIDDVDININAELTLSGPLDIPPPPPADDEDEIPEEGFFMIVEDMPEPIGGQSAIQSSIDYPERARRAGIEGRVYLQFVVNENGDVVDPIVLRGIGGGCDEEALRAIRETKFIPGRQRGRPVPVQMSLPVIFQLQN